MLRVAKHLGLSSQILRVAQDDTDGAQFVSVVAKHAQKSIVILSVAKHPAAKRDRPFAAAQGDTCWTQRLLTLLTCATELPPGSKTKRKGDQVVLVSPVPVAADAPDTFASSLPVDCADFCFGSRGVSAFELCHQRMAHHVIAHIDDIVLFPDVTGGPGITCLECLHCAL